MKKIVSVFVFGFVFVSLTLTGCKDPNEDSTYIIPSEDELNWKITEVLESHEEFSLWVEFLKYADFYNALRDANVKATIFCPTNEAVQEFLEWRGVESIQDLDLDYAKSVAKTHIIKDETISETTIDDCAQKGSTLAQNLFENYLTLTYGYKLADVDDKYKSEEMQNTDQVYVNNQAAMNNLNVISCAAPVTEDGSGSPQGAIYTLDDVIRPLAETILGKLELEKDAQGEPAYTIFTEAITKTGFDSIANKVCDTVYIAGSQVITNYNYTCFAVSDSTYKQSGINSLADLETKVGGSAGLVDYVKYHFLQRKYTTDELFNFQSEGETLIYETQLKGKAIITDETDGVRKINKDINILRSDMEARNGLITKVDEVMPVYDPDPVNVKWDFLNYADVIAYIDKVNGAGTFLKPLENRETKTDISSTDANNSITSFDYKAESSKASFYKVGYYKYKSSTKYNAYMGNYMKLNLGYNGWIQFTSPTIVAGHYKVVFHYCFEIALKEFYTTGSLTNFILDDQSKNAYVLKGLTTKDGAQGPHQITLFDDLEFTESCAHTFRITMKDISAKDNSKYNQMIDYLEFIPINN